MKQSTHKLLLASSHITETSWIMTVKRRNHGRNKKGRGHVKRVRYVFWIEDTPRIIAERWDGNNLIESKTMASRESRIYSATMWYCRGYPRILSPGHLDIARAVGLRSQFNHAMM
jgi:small subunit ribosomal protein S26e